MIENNIIAINKIFYHPERIKAYLDNELVKPIAVKLRLTDRCNLKCYYCSYKDNLSADEMIYADVIKVFQALKIMGVKAIVFTGGEPTVYKDFAKITKIAKEDFQFDIALITNGVQYVNVIPYMTWIRFSLDTINPKEFYQMKGIDRLEDVLKTIQKTLKQKNKYDCTVGIQAIINRYNFDYQFKSIKKVIKFASSLGADYVQIRPLENYKYTQEEIRIIADNIEELKEKNFGIKIITTDYKWHEIENGYCKDYQGCPSANFMGSVDVKGDFYICCAMINDETAKYGNLLIEDSESILLNRTRIQKEFDYRKCTVACQGSLLNQTLSNFKKIKHINFI